MSVTGKATAPYCLRCKQSLRNDPSRKGILPDTCTGSRNTGELTHDQCDGGTVVQSTRSAPK